MANGNIRILSELELHFNSYSPDQQVDQLRSGSQRSWTYRQLMNSQMIKMVLFLEVRKQLLYGNVRESVDKGN